MELIVKQGTGLAIEVGTSEAPEITRWTSWGFGDLQQSFMLHTAEGTLVTDPVLPPLSEALQAIKRRAGKVRGILSLSPLHERHIAEAARRYRAPVYGPASAKKTTQYGRKLDRRYAADEALPGGVRAIESGDETGEVWLYWETPSGKKVLLAADTVYGQDRPGGMGGRKVPFWMPQEGIRLRATGRLTRAQMLRRYEKLASLEIDLLLNGHNAGALETPRAALENVLRKGQYEEHPSGSCTYLYLDF